MKDEIIEELNDLMNEADDNLEPDAYEYLKRFYDWFVERYMY